MTRNVIVRKKGEEVLKVKFEEEQVTEWRIRRYAMYIQDHLY
jgi:hypothetical protein